MKIWKLGAYALASLLGAALTASAPAAPMASNMPVQRFGRVFAMSVCGNISPFGQAHCYAKVVTDARGNILDGRPNRGSRNVTPSGYGPADLQAAYKISPATGSPARATEQTERLTLVRQAVGSLPVDLRQVVVMKEFEEMTFQEISDTLDLPLSTVKSRLYTALRQLRMKLERLPMEIS